MVVKMLMNGTDFECNNSRDILVFPAVAILAKIILEWIKEHLESLIDDPCSVNGQNIEGAEQSPYLGCVVFADCGKLFLAFSLCYFMGVVHGK